MLLVDLGNTRLKWAWWRDGALHDGGVVQHRGRDLALVLADAWAQLPRPAAVRVASVAPPTLRDGLLAGLAKLGAGPVEFAVSRALQAGVHNGYDRPEQLGVDRWLAMIAAWHRVRGPVCVVDCGSALTIDILDRSGQHLGGVIAPGLRLMSEALASGTTLPEVDVGGAPALGRDTRSAVAAGTAEALRGLVDRCRARAPAGARLVLTGGDAALLAAGIDGPHDLIPDLVLEGLGRTLDGV